MVAGDYVLHSFAFRMFLSDFTGNLEAVVVWKSLAFLRVFREEFRFEGLTQKKAPELLWLPPSHNIHIIFLV